MDRVRAFGLAGVGGVLVVVVVLVALARQRVGDVAPVQVTSGLLIAGLLVAVAVIGVLGVRRRSAILLTAAGLAALVPAPLSVGTLPLVVAGMLLLVAARPADRPARAAGWLVVVAIVGLHLGALASLLTLNETRCWLAYETTDGYRWEFVTEAAAAVPLGGPGQPVASGCDSGSPTTSAIGLVAVLGIGSLAIALAAPRPTTARSGG